LYARFITKVVHDLGLVPFIEPFTLLTNQGQVIKNGWSMSKPWVTWSTYRSNWRHSD